jgi:hypothetical protein
MSLVQTLGSAVNGGAEAYFVSLTGAFARAGIPQSAGFLDLGFTQITGTAFWWHRVESIHGMTY